MPNGVASVIIDPTALVLDAKRDEAAAAHEYARAKARWRKLMFGIQAGVALLLFLKWLGHHSPIAAGIMAVLVFLLLTVLQLFAGLFTMPLKGKLKTARSRLAEVRQKEVEHNLSTLKRGRYQWIRRHGDYLAAFTDAGLLYHFGSASGDRHWMLDASRAVKEVRVSTRTHTQVTTTSTTKHGRRLVLAPTDHVAVVGKGRSTTTSTTDTKTTTDHVLEIQVQPEAGASPSWISVSFGADGQGAENWRLLVSQLRN
jgi:hypothetical protein